ncbi:MAG: tetratricopeptide repeat protein [Bdellovibrionales bacterium]
MKSALQLWGIALLSFACTILFNLKPAAHDPMAPARFLSPPPEYIEYFSFGFRLSLSDSLWLRWIQDSDTCQYYGIKSEKLSGKPLFENPRHKVCDNSWGFKILDATTKLDPKFFMPYLAGAIALSVLVEDYDGATVIFDRGLAQYPDDYDLTYRAAYHFLFDRQDYDRAAKLLNHAADLGGPSWLRALASRVYSKTGQLELGLRTLLSYRETIKDDEERLKTIDERIADLKKRLSEPDPP